MIPWLAVIGIGEDGWDGLSGTARTLVVGAELLVGGARHLALIPGGPAERQVWGSDFADGIAGILRRRGRPVAVLASGDPMCYGVGVTLSRHLARGEMVVLPQPGAFSLAAARLGWPLADCTTLSVHGRPLEAVRLHLAPGARLILLAADGTTPAHLAALLAGAGWGPSQIIVLEHLGGPRERLIEGTAAGWCAARGADLNTIAVECRPGPGTVALSRAAGLPDDVFAHDGQLSKREIRAAALAALAPMPGQRLWDIGAGSGSVAIEWLRLAPRAAAVAVERDRERCAIIAGNAAALGVPQLEIVPGEAPAALAGLPPPDAVFLGGGVAQPGLLDALWAALPAAGRLVANAVTLAGEARLIAWQTQHGGELTRLAIARAAPLGAHLGWRPLLPVTQLAAVKRAGGA